MGASQSSPRKLTVINEDAVGVIKISDTVVERLKEELSKQAQQPEQAQAQEASPPPPPPPPPPPQQQHQQQHAPPQASPAAPSSPPAGSAAPPAEPTVVQVLADPSLSALKVRAEKEAELKAVESYWQDRVKGVRNQVLKEEQISETAFQSAMSNIDKMFLKSRGAPICQESRHLAAKCYEQNKAQPLLCAEQVKAFSKCVDSARLGALSRSG